MTSEAIGLGFAVGSGAPVEIPVRHLAVTGQTQESGKTTTLEALVARSGLTALAFVTKRGERSFAGGRRIQPYFRDRADWQFVTSIIDATLQEKNKFLRPWIMKICRTTRTLAEVQAEVRKALLKAKGIHEGVYTQLDAYLDLIVPEIRRAPLAARLELDPGLNVMDVSERPTPMQMLFVQSALDWVNEHTHNTVVVIPEAWEFVPEGRNSPVKASAIALVRKGASVGNRIWVDSQDMAGVDKTILRGCAVWLIGVQREFNEIKRNLANIPHGVKKPTADQVALLQRGQFYACWGEHAVKTYVQPVWMTMDDALAIARGDCPVPQPPAERQERTVTEQEAKELRTTNERLERRIRELEQELLRHTKELRVPAGSVPKSVFAGAAHSGTLELAPRTDLGLRTSDGVKPPEPWQAEDLQIAGEDALYQRFRDRLAREAPALLKVATVKPELEITVKRETIAADGGSLRGRIAQLIAGGFFADGQTGATTQKELGRRGKDPGPGNTYNELNALAILGFFTIEDGRDEKSRPRKLFRAVPEMLVRVVEAR